MTATDTPGNAPARSLPRATAWLASLLISMLAPSALAKEVVCGAILSDGHSPSGIFLIQRDLLVASTPATLPATWSTPEDLRESALWSLFDASLQKVMANNDLGGFRMRRDRPIRCKLSSGDTLSPAELTAWEENLLRNEGHYRAGQSRAIAFERRLALDALLPPDDADWLRSTYYVGCYAFLPYSRQAGLRSRATPFEAGKGMPSMPHVRRTFIDVAIAAASGQSSSAVRDINTHASCGVLGLPRPNPFSAAQTRFFPEEPESSRLAYELPLDLGANAATPVASPPPPPADAAPPAIIVSAPAGPTPDEVAAQQAQARREAAIEAEKQRLGAHREAEIRRLEALREQAAAATPKCTEKTITVDGHSAQDATGVLFQGWATRQEASDKARGKLGHWCSQMTGNAGFGAVTEQCSQTGGRWECAVKTTCSAPQRLCGAATQW